MGYHSRRESFAASFTSRSESEPESDLEWPFGKIEGVDRDDLRETAYEIFFTACRSSPGFGGRNSLTYYPSAQDSVEGGGVGTRANGQGLVVASRIKRALGLKTAKRLSPKRPSSSSSAYGSANSSMGSSPGLSFTTPQTKVKRPSTSAEIMRLQMRVSEQSDNRLRKTLMRSLVGQMGRRVETIIVPLELLRHLKPSEFSDAHEYHQWQKRQLKILEAGLLLYPSIPLDRSNSFAMRLREIFRSTETKPLDTSKNSEIMRTLCNSVISLSWRTCNGSPVAADVCHWADGFPINIHIYLTLLHSIFDLKDETVVVDEVDEMLELMKKTWSTLGINKLIHNVCFTWLLFQQYVTTAEVEEDLLSASLAMLPEVANDAKRADREIFYVKILSSALASMRGWSEKRLIDYHESFQEETVSKMETILPLALSTAKILDEDMSNLGVVQERGDAVLDSTGNKVDYFIRSSLRNAFIRLVENGANSMTVEVEEEMSETLLQLAKEIEELAMREKENFSPILKRWHQMAVGVATVTLHNCYGAVLKQYLAGVSRMTNEVIRVLQRAGKLEKVLVQMVVEDSVDCEDGGKAIVREMVPYEVDSIILRLLKTWIDERMKRGKECLERAKETETWNPKSKTEPYAQSAMEMTKLAKEIVDDFLEIPLGISDEVVQEIADGLELLFQSYTSFVASCGSKQSYIPTLPPLTRCNRGSRLLMLWQRASPCKVGTQDSHRGGFANGLHPRPSTSRGTQRLYIRLNTLHYILSHLHILLKSLYVSHRPTPPPNNRFPNNHQHLVASRSYFDLARSCIQAAAQHISEVAAYRLIFLDSSSVFYESLYVGHGANARIRPALRVLKQNIILLTAILTDRAQPLAIKEVMKATFEAYLMVLLAGGSNRFFSISDHKMIEEDFGSLKRAFCTSGEGLVAEEVVQEEAYTLEGIVRLMAQSTEQLVEDFSIAACEASGLGVIGAGQKLPMPPTTGRWNRGDPNTILRVLCHRNDSTANRFLKRTFQLAKRR